MRFMGHSPISYYSPVSVRCRTWIQSYTLYHQPLVYSTDSLLIHKIFIFQDDIKFFLMVNLADCTKIMFDPQVIHIVHSAGPSQSSDLSTSFFPLFLPKSSYAPTYPHYPHPETVYNWKGGSGFQILHFCTHLINLPISTFFLR